MFMPDSILVLATLGGLISFLSTSLGVMLSFTQGKTPGFFRFKFSIDFALGLMLSAVAFSLVAPAAQSFLNHPTLLGISLLGFLVGSVVIYGLKFVIEKYQSPLSTSSGQLLLALALIIHNFPEGLASGGSLAGLSLEAAFPILMSIALQNIPEGLIMVLCLLGMGWSKRHALIGGFASGVVELIGGILSGVTLNFTQSALPVILMLAGGAMFTSVVIELREKGNVFQHILKPQFTFGLLLVPLLNLLLLI